MKTYIVYWSFNYGAKLESCPSIVVYANSSSEAKARALESLNNPLIHIITCKRK